MLYEVITVDDNLPRLMVCASAYTEAGMTPEQLTLFVQRTIAATQQLISECEQLGVLNPAEEVPDNRAVH